MDDLQEPQQTLKQTRRRFTILYYLNSDWKPQHGGQLRLFLPSNASTKREQFFDVEPIGDRLVIFDSERVEHEVMPSHVPRRAVTIWLHESKASIQSDRPATAPDNASTSTSTAPLTTHIAQKHRIFIAIPSYRDSELIPTVRGVSPLLSGRISHALPAAALSLQYSCQTAGLVSWRVRTALHRNRASP